jgi:hypothetical protein
MANAILWYAIGFICGFACFPLCFWWAVKTFEGHLEEHLSECNCGYCRRLNSIHNKKGSGDNESNPNVTKRGSIRLE